MTRWKNVSARVRAQVEAWVDRPSAMFEELAVRMNNAYFEIQYAHTVTVEYRREKIVVLRPAASGRKWQLHQTGCRGEREMDGFIYLWRYVPDILLVTCVPMAEGKNSWI